MKTAITFLLAMVSATSFGQDTLGTSILYKADDRIVESNSGIETTVPRGWVGVEPRNEETFLFIPVNETNAQMMILIYQYDNRESLRRLFRGGMKIAHNIDIKPVDSIGQRGRWMVADLDVEEAGRDVSGYAEGRCENGFCAVNILIADRKDLDALKNSIYRLSDKTEFNSGMGMR